MEGQPAAAAAGAAGPAAVAEAASTRTVMAGPPMSLADLGGPMCGGRTTRLDKSEAVTADFWMHHFKIDMCPRREPHDWEQCLYAHRGEKARRRHPSKYKPVQCPEARAKTLCPRGEDCPCTHNLFEYWLHPERFRTCICEQGPDCHRSICFFAHCEDERRPLPAGSCDPATLPGAGGGGSALPRGGGAGGGGGGAHYGGGGCGTRPGRPGSTAMVVPAIDPVSGALYAPGPGLGLAHHLAVGGPAVMVPPQQAAALHWAGSVGGLGGTPLMQHMVLTPGGAHRHMGPMALSTASFALGGGGVGGVGGGCGGVGGIGSGSGVGGVGGGGGGNGGTGMGAMPGGVVAVGGAGPGAGGIHHGVGGATGLGGAAGGAGGVGGAMGLAGVAGSAAVAVLSSSPGVSAGAGGSGGSGGASYGNLSGLRSHTPSPPLASQGSGQPGWADSVLAAAAAAATAAGGPHALVPHGSGPLVGPGEEGDAILSFSLWDGTEVPGPGAQQLERLQAAHVQQQLLLQHGQQATAAAVVAATVAAQQLPGQQLPLVAQRSASGQLFSGFESWSRAHSPAASPHAGQRGEASLAAMSAVATSLSMRVGLLAVGGGSASDPGILTQPVAASAVASGAATPPAAAAAMLPPPTVAATPATPRRASSMSAGGAVAGGGRGSGSVDALAADLSTLLSASGLRALSARLAALADHAEQDGGGGGGQDEGARVTPSTGVEPPAGSPAAAGQ